MITDYFFGLWLSVGMWVLELFGDYDGLPQGVIDGVNGISNLFGSTGAFFGALDRWFPVAPFLTVALVSIVVEVTIATIRGVRVLKQLLPFQ